MIQQALVAQPFCSGHIVAGTYSDQYIGYDNGLMIGSISPGESKIRGLPSNVIRDYQPNPTRFTIQLSAGSPLSQDFFNSIAINGTVYATNSVSSFFPGAATQWDWIPKTGFVDGQTYSFVIS